ncbi:hypothetical protein [Neorhizobium sp. T25_13]|uniref:hypothetical protein n=1 Tax=Neorhizobium sp. T25_13 TaxID=2093830 RepID=UPI00155E504F|nr:hypothetical protein [Neorhizobium sp. T25_13]
MWTTDKTRRAHIFPRPFRVAYLVPFESSHALLDAIFDEAMSRWGGRRTPIIRTDGATIADTDWLFLDLWDADLIYSYVPLKDELRDRIAYCLAPSKLETHKAVEGPGDKRAFRPISDQLEWALKSISSLPRIARLQEIRKDSIFEVLDKERGSRIERDLADSFGFLSNCTTDYALIPYARRLSFREIGHEKYAPRFSGEDVISYISDVGELEIRLSKDAKVLSPSQMSDMFCPYLNVLRGHRASWENRLTIVVGDEVDDRLLFWNSIHRYQSLDIFRSNQIFRFSLVRFQEDVPDWIKYLCGGVRNHRHLNGNGAPNVHVVSSSVEAIKIEEIANKIGEGTHIMSTSSKFSVSDIFAPLMEKDPRKEYERSRNLWPAWNWPSTKVTESVRLENNEIDLPCVKPWHTNEFPLGPTTVGAWISDLKIERTEDHSRYSNAIHHWMFPRRLALHSAVKVEGYGKGNMGIPPLVRPTERGCLSIWDDAQWQRPTLSVPRDVDAFYQAIALHHPNTIAERNGRSEKGAYARIEDVKLSDKGRDLLGVLKFFRNLHEAITFLTNPYILSVISKLSATDTAANPERISEVKEELVNRLKDRIFDDGDIERAAKRVLELAARGLQKDAKENEKVSYQTLRQQLRAVAKDGVDWKELDDCLKFLRNQNFLLQGFGWRCARCQHPNWVGLTDITNSLECAVCNSPEDAPVGGDTHSHFKINPFVSAAFAPNSAQDSVIWCLSVLLENARHSFMLTPAFYIKDKIAMPNGTDLDVLACVDGKVHFYEVKRSFAGINQKQIDDLIKVATLIRPDYAGFAIHNDANKDVLPEANVRAIEDILRRIDVKFVLITGDANRGGFHYHDVPPNIGDTMEWNIWRD